MSVLEMSELELIARAKQRAEKVSQRCSMPPGPSPVASLPTPPPPVRAVPSPTITQRQRY